MPEQAAAYDQNEASVVGACIMDNQAFWKVTGTLQPADFATKFLQDAWRSITEVANRGDAYDVVSLSEEFTHLQLGDLARLTMDTPGSANVKAYANIVRDRAIVRQAMVEVSRARSRLEVGDKAAIPDLQMKLESLHRTERPSTDFNEALRTGLDEIEQAQILSAGTGLVGAPTGVPLLDNRLGGLHGGKLIILAARPSLGKTALALQAAQSAARAGFPVGVMSLEMGAGEIAVRAFAHQYSVNNTALAAGDRDTVATLTERLAADPEKMATVRTLPIHIDEDTFTLSGIVARVSEWSRLHEIKLVVVDHLQLIEIEKGMSRNDGLGEITRQLKILAKRLNIPIVLLCQLNREVEKQKRKPRLADLRDSGNIEQDADIVIAIHGDLETNNFGGRDVDIGFLKFRGGTVGWAGQLQFNGPTQTFAEIEHRYASP